MKNQLEFNDALKFINGLEGMAILDKTGAYIFVSEGWQRYTGYSIDEAIGKKVWEVFPETHAREVLKTGKPVFGKPVLKKNVAAFTSYFPRFAQDGSVDGCFLYIIIHGMEDAYTINKQITALSSQVEYYREELSRERGARYGLDHIIGESVAIHNLKKQIHHAARSSSVVLIEGETGSGKELIAHAIHAHSARSSYNFVRVNCSAIPSELMESEFFGYAPGAFTGANRKGKLGRFELADKGSIFLDEINLLSATVQPKFLRALQEREIDPVGGDKSIPVDVRVIAASNIPLEQLVESGKFRNDLYYRLNVLRIFAPPLRERKEDIPLLTEHLIKQLNRQLGMMVEGVSPEVMGILLSYDWPGNVRELQNAIESAMNMTDSDILQKKSFERLISRIHSKTCFLNESAGSNRLKKAMQTYERSLIIDALKSTGGNRAMTARLLGISRAALYQKTDKYDL